MIRRSGALLALALAAPAAAQPAEEIPVRVGETVTGTLTDDDPRLPDENGGYFHAYVIQGHPGSRVVVWMSSDAFDTFLSWGSGDGAYWEEMARDDDGGVGTDSRLMISLGERGELVLRAAAFAADATGGYTLRVEHAADPVAARIRPGQTVQGELAEGDYVGTDGLEDHWTVNVPREGSITLTAASPEFDTFLTFGIWNGEELLGLDTDDDSGPGTSSHLVEPDLLGGEYRVVVRSYSGEQAGPYTLTVAEGALAPPPPDEGEEEEFQPGQDSVVVRIDTPPTDGPGLFTARERLHAGKLVEDTLDTDDARDEFGTYYVDYGYVAREGEPLVVVARSSAADMYLRIGTGRGEDFTTLAFDDDRGGGHDALVRFRAPAAGEYTVRVTTAAPRQRGPFELLLDRDP